MMQDVSDAVLDSIYDFIDGEMTKGNWETLNGFYAYLQHHVKEHPLDVLLAYATASFPGKSKIPSRGDFMKKCMELHPDPELWKGLEQ